MTRHNYKYLLVILAMVCLAMPAHATIVGMMKMPDTSKQNKQSKNSADEKPEGFGDQREFGGTRWIDPVILYDLQDITRTDYTRSYDQGDIDVNKEIVSKEYKIYGIRVKPICAAGLVEKYAYYTYLGGEDASFSFSYQNMYGVKGEPLNESWFCIYPNESISRTYTFEYTATAHGSDYTSHETAYNIIKITGLRFIQTSNGIAFSYALDGKATHHGTSSYKYKGEKNTYSYKSHKGDGVNARYGHFIYFKGARDLLLMLGAPAQDPHADWADHLPEALQHPWARVYFIVEQVQVDAGVVAAVEGVELQSFESETAEVDETEETDADAEKSEEEEGDEEEEDGGILPDDMMQLIKDWFAGDPLGLGKQATPPEAVGIGSVAALISLLLGGVGAVGGGTGGALGGLAGGAGGGALPPPIEGAPSGPAPIQDPFQRIEEKYVTRDPDGSITIKDPITGEPKLYLPDGQGGYDNPLGGGFKSEEDMLNHLAYLDRNSGTLSQDAATAAFNQAQQREQWDTQNARDLARGYSDEMADYKQWKDEEERKTNQIIKLADKYCVAADEESVRKAVKAEMIKAGIESAKQEAEAARNDMIVVGLESTKNVAATSLVMIPLALSGVGTVSATTMAKVKIWQSVYTMSTSVIDKVGDAYVKGENTGTAAVHGLVTGTVGVIQNYAGNMGGLKTEAAIVIGGEGFKAGYEEYTSSGDLNKTLDKTIEGIKTGTVNHAINKTLDFGINKAKGWASSSKANVNKANVESTRAQADATGKTVTTRQQALTQAQNKVTTAKGNVTKAQQNVTRSQQQVANAQGKVNTANKQLSDANKKVDAALKQLKQASKPADVSKAQADLKTAQQGAAQAQQNVNRANSELKSAQQKDYAAKRVAMNAENNLQKAQMGAQKAQSDLKAANAQHEQALRGAYAAEQQAQIDKFNNSISAPASGSDIGNVKDFLEKEGYISKDDK